MSAQVQQACPECSGTVHTADGETVCEECGVVLDDQAIDHGPEWRSFDGEGRERSRVGPQRTERRHDHGLGSHIGFSNAEGNAKKLGRLRRRDGQASLHGKKNRNKAELFTEAQRIASQLGLGDGVIDRICRVVRVGHDNDVAVGESLDTFAAASVVAGARDHGAPVSITQVLPYTDASRRDLYRVLQKTLDTTNAEAPPVEPVEYLPRIASTVEAASETEALARRILLEVQERALHVGKNPAGVAGGALYAAGRLTGQRFTQRELAEVADVSTVTLRDRYLELDDEGVVEEVTDGE